MKHAPWKGAILALLLAAQGTWAETNIDVSKYKPSNTRKNVAIAAGIGLGAGVVLMLVGLANAEEKSSIWEEDGTTYVDVSGEQHYEPNGAVVAGMFLTVVSGITLWAALLD